MGVDVGHVSCSLVVLQQVAKVRPHYLVARRDADEGLWGGGQNSVRTW